MAENFKYFITLLLSQRKAALEISYGKIYINIPIN